MSTTPGPKTPIKGAESQAPAPSNPIMGIYQESYAGAGDWYAISGGKPLPDWTGLDPNAYKTSVNPRRHRPVSAHQASKAYAKRIEGLETKFKQGDNLNDFRYDMSEALVKNGLDTISYLQDLEKNDEMYSIITDYPRFVSNFNKAVEIANATSKKYDLFDKMNSEAAIEFLENSLEISLKRRLDLLKEDNDSFACVWLRLMHLLASFSSDHYDSIREKVRKTSPAKFDRENISQMIKAVTHDIAELECANQYEPQISVSMLQSISTTCSQGGFFSHMLFKKIIIVKEKVAECNFMSKQDANNHMKKANLDPRSILKEIEEEYISLLKDNLWTPAKLPVDQTKASLNQVSCQPVSQNVNELTAQVLALLKSTIPSKPIAKKTRGNSPCNICGQIGHWSPECPEKKREQSTSTQKKGSQAWRRVPPSPGQPETKMHKKREFFWCEKCKRWTPSHGTATHRGSQVKDKGVSDQSLAANLVIDPSVWLMSTTDTVEPMGDSSWMWSCLGYFLLVFYFLPFSTSGRLTCLLGLWNSLLPLLSAFSSLAQSYFSVTLLPLLNSIASCILSIPLSCFGAPLLWTFLFWAISFAKSFAENQQIPKKEVRPRSGRIKDPLFNTWNRRRRYNASHKKLSLRHRLRLKAQKDLRDKFGYFDLDPFDKPHWKSRKNIAGNLRLLHIVSRIKSMVEVNAQVLSIPIQPIREESMTHTVKHLSMQDKNSTSSACWMMSFPDLPSTELETLTVINANARVTLTKETSVVILLADPRFQKLIRHLLLLSLSHQMRVVVNPLTMWREESMNGFP